MTWEYVLIGLILGFIIGALVVHFWNTKLHNQQVLQSALEKKNYELKEYHKELISYFLRSAELLDNMAQDYRQLYQHMVKSSHSLMPDIQIKNNLSDFHLTKSGLNNDQASINLPPKDYSESSSKFFYSIKEKE